MRPRPRRPTLRPAFRSSSSTLPTRLQNLVTSLSQPGGNLTGVFGARDPVVKQLQIYKQIMPTGATC